MREFIWMYCNVLLNLPLVLSSSSVNRFIIVLVVSMMIIHGGNCHGYHRRQRHAGIFTRSHGRLLCLVDDGVVMVSER
jgi:hypothetical protein